MLSAFSVMPSAPLPAISARVKPHSLSSDEAAAMLAYMVHHNEHHIEELADIAAKLPEEVRAKITEAAEIMKKGNALLREAAEQVK